MTAHDLSEPRIERADDPSAGVAVLDLAGELDLACSTRLRELVDAVTSEKPRLVVADVSEVGFMDSTVLREFLRAHREAEEAGAKLVVAGAQPSVRRLLELTGTDGLFLLAASRDAALSL